MRKKIILFLLLLFTSGCSVDYTLSINENKYTEEISEVFIDTELYENELNARRLAFYSDSKSLTDSLNNSIITSFPSYNRKVVKNQKNNIIKYYYEFTKNNYSDSSAVKNCYDYVKVIDDDKKITITTSNKFNCLINTEIKNITITIKSKYKVIQSNADIINGKKHTWNITQENYDNKPIIYVYDESKKDMNILDYLFDNIYFWILMGGIIVIVGTVFIFIRVKSKKVNKI